MASLKSLIPGLARALDMKPAALYERQRALVRAGLLEMRPGHGPGSGVPATARSLAMLLITIAATSSLSEVEEQARIVANLKSTSGRCPLTGKKTFADALTAILDSKGMRGVQWFDIERRGAAVQARIYFKSADQGRVKESDFGVMSVRHKHNTVSKFSLFLRTAILEAAMAFWEETNK